mgnify:CR=1 FL=1
MALLSLQQIHKTFEKGTVNENHVLRGLDLDIEQGDFISVIGGNGAGKSTLMNSIAGVLSIDEGDILLEGQSIKKASVDERSKDISRVFQDPRMGTATNLSIEENMAIAYRRGKKRSFFKKSITESERQVFKEALVDLGLGLENRMKTDANFLSGGQRQALTLAMATLVRPKILLLDEHTAALDPKTSDMVMNLTRKIVEEQELTTLMITHNMRDALRFGNRLIMMDAGRIIYDVKGEEKKQLTVADLLQKFEVAGENALSDRMVLGAK